MSLLSTLRSPRGAVRKGVVVSAVAILSATLFSAPAQAAAAPAPVAPAVPYQLENGVTKPIYSYENAIREHVWVKSTQDSDYDGKPDMIAVDIIRPREAAAAGLKVPVIMDASPYYQSTGRGNESQVKKYDANGLLTQTPLYYDNYFVPRGYAIVQPEVAGTNKSTGCGDVGGEFEIGSIKATIDWLNGRAQAYTDVEGTSAPVVVDWHSGKTGMIGKSWDGTLANGVAATGVEGLTTIVPISAIDSWYNYHRYNGARFTSTTPVSLHSLVSRFTTANTPCAVVKADLTAGNSVDGNYTDFWAERDYTKDVSKVKASVFLIHGMNDTNVKPTNMDRWWAGLAANNVPRKIWVSQYGHVDPFDFRRTEFVDTLHQWFDYWLQGVENGIMAKPMADIQTSTTDWETATSWPVPLAKPTKLQLSPGDAGAPGLLTINKTPSGTQTFTGTSQSETNMIANPTVVSANKLQFLSPVLTNPVRISGSPQVDLKVSSTQADGNLTFLLVDLGADTYINSASGDGVSTPANAVVDCLGQGTALDTGCFKRVTPNIINTTSRILSRGWVNVTHRESLASRVDMPLNQPVAVSWNAMPQDWTIKAGHRLAVIIGGNDSNFLSNVTPTPDFKVYLGESSVTLPIVGSPVASWIPEGTGNQVITANLQGGALKMTAGTDVVALGTSTITGVDQFVSGALNSSNVSDGRGSSAGWALTGQVSDFAGPNGIILADNLGWTPAATAAPTTLAVLPGSAGQVIPGQPATPGAGLGTARTLCLAAPGHSAGTFKCDAGLTLGLPGSSRIGDYTGLLTLTLI